MLPVYPADVDDGARHAADERWRTFPALSWWAFISGWITEPLLLRQGQYLDSFVIYCCDKHHEKKYPVEDLFHLTVNIYILMQV